MANDLDEMIDVAADYTKSTLDYTLIPTGEDTIPLVQRPQGSRPKNDGFRDRSYRREEAVEKNSEAEVGDLKNSESDAESISGSSAQPESSESDDIYERPRKTVKALAWVVKFLLFASVLICLLYSKLTVIQIFEELHLLSNFSSPIDPLSSDTNPEQVAATLYWMLLFIVLIPNIITWFRGFLNGVLSKSSERHWPTTPAIFLCVMVSLLESLAESFLFFYAFIALPPTMSLLLMCGVCRIESIYDLITSTKTSLNCDADVWGKPCIKCLNTCKKIALVFLLIILFICQVVGVISLIVITAAFGEKKVKSAGSFITAAVCLLVLSITWFGRLQRNFFQCEETRRSSFIEEIKAGNFTNWLKGTFNRLMMWLMNLVCVGLSCAKATQENDDESANGESTKATQKNVNINARWKASFVAATVRLLIYPFASYVIFRFLYPLQFGEKVDPWAHSSLAIVFQWTRLHINVFTVHVATSLLGYILSWIACYMTLHFSGLALPVIVATPLSLLIYFSSSISYNIHGNILILYPFQKLNFDHFNDWKNLLLSEPRSEDWYIVAVVIASFFSIGQIIATLTLYNSKNAILASDKDMFVRPYYNSVLLEQSLIINRSVQSNNKQGKNNGKRDPYRVYVCSTMFHETITEMRQMLQSIQRIAKEVERKPDKNGDKSPDKYESHIFFDGGCREDVLTEYALQLMSLLPSTLNVELENCERIKTPYGNQFRWKLAGEKMPFVVHLKDNLKVRNKKRWSQVMYMNYIINYRHKDKPESDTPESDNPKSGKSESDIPKSGKPESHDSKSDNSEGKYDLEHTCILTTDADIEFTAKSADVLLDMLDRNPLVGAVCSRTRPLGEGPLYWYQVFDYAIGHWLQKSTEHVFGCVLCCPGCFSIFRCSALEKCLQEYSTEVENASEFLTKDMGEDRWLCTLLVEKGWRLEYCAISNNSTYCPVSFDEFYKQRRRWIPSTIANLWLLVTKGSEITSKNKYISWAFIAYQIIILFSTIISPATVILVIASGLQTAFGLNSTAVVVTLSIVTLCYGIICICPNCNQKTQLDIAKYLTFLSSIMMAVVVAGLIMDFGENILSSLHTPDNLNDTYVSEIIHNKKLPVAETTIYTGLFAVIFVVTGILHFGEGFALFQSLWYLLGLPSGYLLLLIYSAANLNDRSWGTREKKNTSEESFLEFSILKQNAKKFFNSLMSCSSKYFKRFFQCKWCTNEPESEQIPSFQQKKATTDRVQQGGGDATENDQEHIDDLDRQSWLWRWLSKMDIENEKLQEFYKRFKKHGYTEQQFVAGMSKKDLEDIGIQPTGYQYHLLQAIKKIARVPFKLGVPDSVEAWIKDMGFIDSLKEEYVAKFKKAGYYGEEDVVNLTNITEDELKTEIDVTKKAHRNRFVEAIKLLRVESEDEKRMTEAENKIQDIPIASPVTENVYKENEFWVGLVTSNLKPVPDDLTQANKLRNDLKFLRNYTLLAIFHINLLWLILLSVLTFNELHQFGLSANILGLLFLAVYAILITVQFIGMLLHRAITFCHFIARLDEDQPSESRAKSSHSNSSSRGLKESIC